MTRGLTPQVLCLLLLAGLGACGVKTAVLNTTRADVAALESRDQALAGALAALRLKASADAYRLVGVELIRLDVLDQAHEYLSIAIQLNSKNARASEARARIWREWRMGDRALEDIKRAVRLAPGSPDVHNTAGTIFFLLNLPGEAVREFTKALTLDPTAAYAANNLCYLAFLSGDAVTAEAHCQTALRLSPNLAAAHQNLALVYAATDMVRAERALMAGGDTTRVHYNLGILYLARREYPQAATAFETACAAEPPVQDACERARRTRALVKGR